MLSFVLRRLVDDVCTLTWAVRVATLSHESASQTTAHCAKYLVIQQRAVSKRVAPTMGLLDALSGRVTRSARFREYVDAAFAEVDHNANGSLDRAELHLAVVLFFDKLNAKVKKRAVPPVKAELMALFDEVDVDKSGELSNAEFTVYMERLCAQTTSGLTVSLLKSFIAVPATAIALGVGIKKVAPALHEKIKEAKGLGSATISFCASQIVNKVPAFAAVP